MTLEIISVIVIAVVASVVVQLIAHWDTNRRLYSLECDVADLQTKVLSEIKRRAQQEGVKARRSDKDLLDKLEEAVQTTKQVATSSTQPWWMQHVPADLKKGS